MCIPHPNPCPQSGRDQKADQDQFRHPSLPTLPTLRLACDPVCAQSPSPVTSILSRRRASPALISQSFCSSFSSTLSSPHHTSPSSVRGANISNRVEKNTTHARCPRDIKQKGICAHHAHLQRSLSINALSHEFQAILTLLQRSAPAASLRRTFYSR
jgi:hypothetical protein